MTRIGRKSHGLAPALALAALVWASTAAAQSCPGDCDENGVTSTIELDLALRLLFDADALGTCAAADADGSGEVTAGDVIAWMLARAGLREGCTAAAPRSHWTTLAPLPGGPRQEVAAAVLDGTLYVLGGFDGMGRGTALAERYDVASDTWMRVADLPQPLNHAGAAVLGGAVYAVGGYVGSSFQATAAVSRYDPAADAWTPVAPLPAPRGALAIAVLDGRVHALGGNAATSVTAHAAYDPEVDEWIELAPFPGPGRNHLAAVELGDFIYLIGGRRDGGGVNNVDRLDRYDPATDSWVALAPLPTARSGLGAAVLHGKIVVLGGEVSPTDPFGVFPHVEMYDPAADRWARLDDMPLPRHGIWTATIADRLYVPGGATRAGFGATAHHDALAIGF